MDIEWIQFTMKHIKLWVELQELTYKVWIN